MRILPTMYMTARVYERHHDDCASALQQFYIPVDTHTASLVVTVRGGSPGILFHEPQGRDWRASNILLSDKLLSVSQAITCKITFFNLIQSAQRAATRPTDG